MFFKLCNHREIDPDERISIIIESPDDEFETHRPLNLFGAIINDYDPDSSVPIIPLVVGQISPGMLMSYLSAMTTIAVEMLKDTDIPREVLKELLQRAVDEGLNGKIVPCKCQN